MAAVLAGLLANIFSPLHLPGAVHDVAADFSLDANPTSGGWQYSESVANGGGPVGARGDNWNAPDFGPGQPGWLGMRSGAHAGWALRIDNGNDTPTYDDPVGTILTHGNTSVLWKSPPGDTDRFATISGGLWNIRHFNRSGTWRLLKNDSVLSQGTIDDLTGTSDQPLSLESGSGGSADLRDIPYHPGDFFRLEILQNDFVAVRFTITTTATTDPFISAHPQSQLVVAGSAVTFSATASGSAPLTYQWQQNGVDVPGATGPSHSIASVSPADGGSYRVVVTSPGGSRTSRAGVLVIDAPGPVTPSVHDLTNDFTLQANPTSRGWQYSQALDAGGGVVGPVSFNWVESVFGANQPGWLGIPATPFIGWAKRIDNAKDLPNLDAPFGAVMTHGTSSVKWTAAAGETDRFATISGGIWSIERNARGQKYRIWKNDMFLLAEQVVSRGSSDTPNSFDRAPTAMELAGVPYSPGDSFRLEILPLSGPGGSLMGPYGDLQGVQFTITTSTTGPDPAIATHPFSQKVNEGDDVTFTVAAVGAAPFSYQWFYEGVEIAGETGASLALNDVAFERSGTYTVQVSNGNGSRTSLPANLQVTPRPDSVSGARHDLSADFSLDANPTATGWQYSESIANGGGPVGNVVPNWNQPDFGPSQPGWVGVRAGAHAGWAKRIDNGSPTPTYDDPVGSIITHGPTSVMWTAPPDDRGGVADIRGSLWNIRHLNRPSNWRILKNDTELLTDGVVDDNSGDSRSPLNFANGSSGPNALRNIPYQAGDSFRFEVASVGVNDFVALNMTIITRQLHDASADFSLEANPTSTGWQYSRALADGGGIVGPVTPNWNQPDFGGGQPGWQGASPPGAHAGWARRVDNGNPTPPLDDPEGTIMTHGRTSLLWRAPGNDPGGLADLSGGLWNLRRLNRSGTWRLWKNDTILITSGAINDDSGASGNPLNLAAGDSGPGGLRGIRYRAGDTFRLEVLEEDFVGVRLRISTYPVPADPIVSRHPDDQTVIAGGDATFSIRALGTSPISFQWQFKGADLPGQTSSTLTLTGVSFAQAGQYRAVVSNAVGVVLSDEATLTVKAPPPAIKGTRHSLAADFKLDANPTSDGWQYSESLGNGGGPVGPVVQNWNQPDFGANQPGWVGARAGAHAGWARRVDNGNATPSYDDPPGTILTHGATSVLWKAPANDRGGVADISGGLWNIRHFGRSGTWRLWHNDTILISEGIIDDSQGTSAAPKSFATGSGGESALRGIAYGAGDTFRLEILAGDFVAVDFALTTRKVHDLVADFALDANPTATGWQYSESLGNGGGPVGAAVENWNQPDFGAGQTGWVGARAGAHAGWAKRIDNGNATPNYDDPIGSVLTHGPTSVLWTAPPNDPGGVACLAGGFWNIRQFGRSGLWRLWGNETNLLSEGTINDSSGTSTSPKGLNSGSGGAAALLDLPYSAGDSFRLEILQGDFVSVQFSIATYTPDPPLTVAIRVAGTNVEISWTGAGTLQEADAVTGAWSDSANANNPHVVPPTMAAKFYRLIRR